MLKRIKERIKIYEEAISYREWRLKDNSTVFEKVIESLRYLDKGTDFVEQVSENNVYKFLDLRGVSRSSLGYTVPNNKQIIEIATDRINFINNEKCHFYKGELNCFCDYDIFTRLRGKTNCRVLKIKKDVFKK